MSLRPGASEIYRVLVPCALAGNHIVHIRLKWNNHIAFEHVCDRKEADAFTRLGGGRTCLVSVTTMKESIRSGRDDADVHWCRGCYGYVVAGLGCPSGHYHESSQPGFWRRMLRDGRVR